MTTRPCLDCGTPTTGTRCPPCAQIRDQKTDARRGTRTARGYDARWLRLSARARRAQPFCSDCGTVADLTGDHLRWPARRLTDVDVVCRSCNAKRGATRGDTRVRAAPEPPVQADSRLHTARRRP